MAEQDETDDADEQNGDELLAQLARLADWSGRTILAETDAWERMQVFADGVTKAFIREHHMLESIREGDREIEEGDAVSALSMAFADELEETRSAGQVVNTLPHQRIITVSDITAILVEAAGGEPSDATMVGHGSTADMRHDEDIDTLIDLSPYSTKRVSDRIDEMVGSDDE